MAIFLSRIKKVLNLGMKSITSNGTYNASSDGYDGYSQVTVNVSGGGGTPITPSNANPVALTSGNTVTPTAAGYAIESYNSVTPSNSSPAAMSSGGVYQPTANGYAIASYDSKTPSDSTPPSVASGDIVKMGGAGYLYASQQGLDPTGMSISAGSVQTSGYTTTIDDGDYVVVVFRTNAPTSSYSMDYIKNYQVTRIRNWSEITVSVSGTTLTVTRQSTASTVYIMKLS